MRFSPFRMLGLLLALQTWLVAAEETATLGGVVMPVARGWTQTAEKGTVILSPSDLPQGVACRFTLLGGEAFNGSLKDRLAAEWKEFEALGPVLSDDGGKITGAGNPVVVAGRSGQIQMNQGVTVNVWLLVVEANGRIERMVFVTTTPEAFTKYAVAVSEMLNNTKYGVPKPAAVPAPGAKETGTIGRMTYTIPEGWREKRGDGLAILSPISPPRNESIEIVILPALEFTGSPAAALERSWDDAAQRSGFTKTRSVNNTAFNINEELRTSFRGWSYLRADGVMTSNADSRDYYVNLTVLQINGRYERVFVRGRQNIQNLQRYSLYQDPGYRQAIHEFLFSLRFEDWKEPKVQAATLKGDGIIGAWFGVGMFGGKLHTGYAIFFSNGQAFFGSRFPLRGCHDFNTWIDAEEVPRYWGTYQFKAGKGSITMPYGEIPIEANGTDLVLTAQSTGHRYVRLPPVDGNRLEGTYTFPESNGRVPSIRFTGDGQFSDNGALNLLRIETSYPFSPTAEPGGGIYTIRDFTMLLDYKDGRKYRIAYPGLRLDDRKSASPEVLPLGYGDQSMVLKR